MSDNLAVPAALTRGYASAFLDMLARVGSVTDTPPPTTHELNQMDKENAT